MEVRKKAYSKSPVSSTGSGSYWLLTCKKAPAQPWHVVDHCRLLEDARGWALMGWLHWSHGLWSRLSCSMCPGSVTVLGCSWQCGNMHGSLISRREHMSPFDVSVSGAQRTDNINPGRKWGKLNCRESNSLCHGPWIFPLSVASLGFSSTRISSYLGLLLDFKCMTSLFVLNK